jgi:hypothetical protein
MRAALWLFTVFVAFVVAGGLSLYLVAYLVSAVASEFTAREYVLATQTLLWIVLADLALLGVGRALFDTVRLRASAATLLTGVVAVVVSFVTASDARARSGALDIDQIGIAVWVPALLAAVSVAQLGADSAPPELRWWWSAATLLGALAAIGGSALALAGRMPYGIPATVALVAALATATALGIVSVRSMIRAPAGSG